MGQQYAEAGQRASMDRLPDRDKGSYLEEARLDFQIETIETKEAQTELHVEPHFLIHKMED